jgi:hypothetical protein
MRARSSDPDRCGDFPPIITGGRLGNHGHSRAQLLVAGAFSQILSFTDRCGRPALLAGQIIPADLAVTNYLGREAVYSDRCTARVALFARGPVQFPP